MIETVLDRDRFVALFQSRPSTKAIEALVEQAKNSPARIRIVEIIVPSALQKENSRWLKSLRRDWQTVGATRWLLNIRPDTVHDDPKIARMRAGIGN